MIIGSKECIYCSEADKKAKIKKREYKFKYEFREYPSIKEAIEEAQKFDKNIDAIPAFFVNGKYRQKSPL